MRINNPNNFTLNQIVEKLTQAGFEIKQDKRAKNSYSYINGKNKFLLSVGFGKITVGILPKNIVLLIIIMVLFGGATAIYTWFVLYFVSSLTVIVGTLVGAILFVSTYRILNKEKYQNEIKKIQEIINK